MSNEILLAIGDTVFTAKLKTLEATKTSKAFINKLPISGKVIHARWSGEAIWLPMDAIAIDVPFENHTSHPSKGDLLYYPGGISEKELLIPYGSALFSSKVGQLQGNHFATIVDDLKKLQEIGVKVLFEGPKPITITQG